MAILIAFVFTFFLIFNIAIAQSNVTLGSSLTTNGVNTSWLSPSGLYAFGFYPQAGGYAIGIYIVGMPERPVVWTASRDKLPLSNNATLHFTTDGRLIVDQTEGPQINIFDVGGASFGSMQDSGNFVLFDSQGTTVLWQSFDYPTETLLVGQRLVPLQRLLSSVSETDQSVGVFQLIMQTDGNLVQYPNVGSGITPSNAYYASNTAGNGPNVTLNLDSDGFLYLLQNSTIFIRNLTQEGYPTKDAIYRMKIDVDGIFRLYYHDLSNTSKNGLVIWASSSNKCIGRGLCGVNGYCFMMNDEAYCRCLPGFESVNIEFQNLGCQRNYTIESCKTPASFRMIVLNNARWEDATYAIPTTSTQEECSSACLNDCNCEAALFTGRECSLQRLPLRFIEVSQSESNVGLIKVYTASVNNISDPTNQPIDVKKVQEKKFMVIGVSLISFAVMILLISAIIVRRTQVWAYRKISENPNFEPIEDIGPRAFSYGELERITNGFKDELGRGSFGIVYKGVIENSNQMVAVKKIREELAQEGEREFQTKMKVIGRSHHRNLVRILGYCYEGRKRILVFEYMTQGSLAEILFMPKESMVKPSWLERMRMAVDIAHGLLYLHEECENATIHCDIKPQNILLDEYGCAKISDFGLAKLLEHDQTRTSTFIRGTRGYVAPEWHKKLPITVKVDVYSYGIVLFNILCCRRNVDNNLPDDEVVLEEWVYRCYEEDEILKLVDYEEDLDTRTLERMVRIGLWCIQEDLSLRPSMKKVLLMLEGTVKIPIPPNPISFLSIV